MVIILEKSVSNNWSDQLNREIIFDNTCYVYIFDNKTSVYNMFLYVGIRNYETGQIVLTMFVFVQYIVFFNFI